MYRLIFCLGLSFFTVSSTVVTHAASGKIVQTDPTYITHKVVAGETLYSLSRKYGISVAQIQSLNPVTKAGLKVGQELRFPGKKAETATPVAAPKPAAPAAKPVVETPAKPVAEPEAPAAAGRKVYKVGPKETLYSVAVKHGVTMMEIRKWNNLKEDKLTVGQQLIVDGPAAATASVAKPAETTKTTVIKEDVKVKADKVKTEVKTEDRAEAPVTVVTTEKDDDEIASVEAAGKITETGLAEVITQAGDNNKYLALHKTAPIGTILQVKNIMNGQNVYVRVIGKLPETGANERVIVRISKKAYQRLAAIDNRFRVEVSYMP